MVERKQIAVSRMAGPAGPRPAVAAMTPKEVFGILRRHILLVISLTILGFMIGGAAWYLLRKYAPKYTAQTYIKVLPPVEKDPMTIGRGMVGKDIQYGHRLSTAALIGQQSTLQRLIDRDKIQETKWFKRFGEVKAISIVKAFKNLRNRFAASAQRDGDYVVLSMTCGDRAESALIVNEMVDMFLALQGSTKRAGVADRLAQLTAQQNSLQRDLDAAEKSLQDVRTASGLTDLEQRYFQHTVTLALNQLQLMENELLLQIGEAQSNMQEIEKLAVGPVTVQIEQQIERDPVMMMLTQRRVLMETQLAGILSKFGENHRTVRETQELINEVKVKRTERKVEIAEQTRQANLKNAQSRLTVWARRLEDLTKMRQETDASKRDLDLARVQYQRRAAIRDERKQMLNAVKQQLEKLKIMHDDPETPKVQFVGYAPVPLMASFPKWKIFFPGGTMLGLVFGIGLAFLIELLSDLVRTPKDVARFLHIPLLGIIPDAAEDEQLRDVDLFLAVRQAPYSIISESYRRLRTNLKLSEAADSKVLLVSSGAAGDGKTSVAVNLATTFVAENKKVLLIDANFRQPSLQTIFPKSEAEHEEAEHFGLSSLLMAQCGCQNVIRHTGIEGLSLIDSGPLPFNPTELLGSTLMEDLIKEQRKSYDYVIIDGPPVLVVSDAKVLAKFVDGTVLVFNAGATRRGAAQRTIRELKEVNATIVGCVLLAVKAMKGGYFQEQFKSYQEYQKLQLARTI